MAFYDLNQRSSILDGDIKLFDSYATLRIIIFHCVQKPIFLTRGGVIIVQLRQNNRIWQILL